LPEDAFVAPNWLKLKENLAREHDYCGSRGAARELLGREGGHDRTLQKSYNLIYLVQPTVPQGILMYVTGLLIFTFIGMALIAAVSVALYAALPRSFLESAERHGRFRGLQQDQPLPNGTPMSLTPEMTLSVR
jgi:hypothetical protein